MKQLAVAALLTLLSSCAPVTVTAMEQAPATGCRAVTGVAVQDVLDGDYGSAGSRLLRSALQDAGYRVSATSAFVSVATAPLEIHGLLDHWAKAQDDSPDELAWRVGVADVQVVDRATNTVLNRVAKGQRPAWRAEPTLSEFVSAFVSDFRGRYCPSASLQSLNSAQLTAELASLP
jgi:hypothetical protein